MPVANVIIPDNKITVARGVQDSAIKALLQYTKCRTDFTIIFEEEGGRARQRISKDKGKDQNVSNVKTDADDIIFLNVVETVREDLVGESMRMRDMSSPIVSDPALGIRGVTVYIPMDVQLTAKIRFRNKVDLDTWLRQLALLDKSSRLSYKVNVRYDYVLPPNMMQFLQHIYTLRESVAAYGDTQDKYLSDILHNEIVRSNKSGSYSEFAINEMQRNIQIWFTSSVPYNEKAADEGIFETEIQLDFGYDCPVAINFKFPYIVHNQLIERKYIDNWITYDREPYLKEDDIHTTHHLVGLVTESDKKHVYDDGIPRTVEFDDFYPIGSYPHLRTLVITPIRVMIEDLHDVHSLNSDELKPYLNQGIRDYIAKYPETTYEYMLGPYFIELFGVGTQQFRFSFTIDSDLNIRANLPMVIRDRYWLRVSALVDHYRLPNKTIKTFLDNVQDTRNAFAGIVPGLLVSKEEKDGALHSPTNTYVTERSYNKILVNLKSSDKILSNKPDRRELWQQRSQIINIRDF